MTKIPSYRRHKPSKQAVTLSGKDFYLGPYGTKESRDNYSKLVAEYLKLKGEEAPPELLVVRRSSKSLTVIEAVDRYLAYSTSQHSKVERAHVRGMLKCLVALFENERAANIRPADLREIRSAMVTGMRPAELCMLRPCDLDFGNDVWLYRPERHKTQHHGRSRTTCSRPRESRRHTDFTPSAIWRRAWMSHGGSGNNGEIVAVAPDLRRCGSHVLRG